MGTARYVNRRCRVAGTDRGNGWVGCANHPRGPGAAEPSATSPPGEAKDLRGGAPRKSPTGLDKVLYVRADQRLLDRLDAEWRRRCKANPGVAISRADVARSILWEGLQDRKNGAKS